MAKLKKETKIEQLLELLKTEVDYKDYAYRLQRGPKNVLTIACRGYFVLVVKIADFVGITRDHIFQVASRYTVRGVTVSCATRYTADDIVDRLNILPALKSCIDICRTAKDSLGYAAQFDLIPRSNEMTDTAALVKLLGKYRGGNLVLTMCPTVESPQLTSYMDLRFVPEMPKGEDAQSASRDLRRTEFGCAFRLENPEPFYDCIRRCLPRLKDAQDILVKAMAEPVAATATPTGRKLED